MKPVFVASAAIAVSIALAGCAAVSQPEVASPQTLSFPDVRTLAGDGQPGAIDGLTANSNARMWAIEHGVPGAENGLAARVNRPHGLSYANDGSLYFADRGNHQVRVLRPDGTVATVAGSGKAGFADGPAGTAQFNEPIAVAVERTGAIYVADRNNHRIRKITPDGRVVTLAGDGQAGYTDGSVKSARFNQPYGVALDAAQTTLYVADYLNHAVRRVDLVLDQVDTLAGNGTAGFADGQRGGARFNQPYNVRVDGKGRLWVPDQLNHAVRRVTPAGEVTTVAGSGKPGYADGPAAAAQFNNPTGVAPLPNGVAVVADRNNNRLRLVAADGSVTTVAGTGEPGYADGPVAAARFNQPLDVDFDDRLSRVLVSEDKGHRLRALPKDTGKAGSQ